jgi:hypothetical protein
MTVDKWEQRMLCPDGGCVGVIGMDGKCKACGTPAPDWGDPRKPGRVSSSAEDGELEDSGPVAAKPVTAEDRAKKTWTSRQLCSDGSCIGVIGSDGTCKVCGKPAEMRSNVDEDEDEDEDEDASDEDDVRAGDAEDEDDEDENDDDDEARAGEEDDDSDDDEIDDGEGDEDDDENEGVDDDDSDDDDDEIDDRDGETDNDDDKAGDEDRRQLCSDGACVGVIGDDGKCKVCGKAAA